MLLSSKQVFKRSISLQQDSFKEVGRHNQETWFISWFFKYGCPDCHGCPVLGVLPKNITKLTLAREAQWLRGYYARPRNEWSGFEPWPMTLCCQIVGKT